MKDADRNSILAAGKVSRSLNAFMPADFAGTPKEALVSDIVTMAIAGNAVSIADQLLKNHGIEGVVLTTT